MKNNDPRIQTNSTVSSMRWMFITTVTTVLVLTAFVVGASIVASFVGKSVDLVGLTSILSPISLFAFGGKALQSRFEQNSSVEDATVIVPSVPEIPSSPNSQE
jgi:hypothetical protein